MAKIDEKYRNAYNSSAVILSSDLELSKVFPEYFMEQVKASNGHLYKILEGNDFMENMKPNIFQELIQREIKKYNEDISSIEEKSNFIASWEAYDDKQLFFQYVMSQKKLLQRLKGFEIEDFKNIDELVKTNEFPVTEAIQYFGIDNEELLEYEKKFETYVLA